MQISAILIGLVLLGAAMVFVTLPFRQKNKKGLLPLKDTESQNGQREAVLGALRDLDFDFKTGKVSEEDYQPVRVQLLAEAAQYMEVETKEDEQIEALIQNRRKAKTQSTKCNQCGAPMEVGQRFCPRCGSSVSVSCPSCGKSIRAGDAFCSSCGTKVDIRMEVVTP